ncbi:MAG: hypothetical protein D6729_12205 [Deltaproteobacteria bacterium]|nr:MAG: hypothetical protein D6729_12205 [Deltaproteobacteria bacterium]
MDTATATAAPAPPSPGSPFRRPALLRLLLLALAPSLACAGAKTPTPTVSKPPRAAARPPSQPLEGEKAQLVQAAMAEAAQVRGLAFTEEVEAREGGPELVAWLVDRAIAESKASGRFEADAAMLQAFRFIPPGYDLEGALETLLGEQARGIYDHRDRTLLVIDLPPGEAGEAAALEAAGIEPLKLYLVHELVHALQDQHFDLSRLMDERPELTEDTSQAYRALAEGDASYAMYDWLLTQSAGRHIYEVPNLEQIRDGIRKGLEAPQSTALREAPLYLRETLLFAYADGLLFVDALYRDGGWERVNAAYESPPTTTEQILHPEKYLAGEGALAVEAPPAGDLEAGGFTKVAEGRLGELGLSLFLQALAGEEAVDRGVAAGWGGDHYTVWRDPAGRLGAAWRIRFDAPDLADRFAEAAAPIFSSAPELWWRREGPDGFLLRIGLPEPPTAASGSEPADRTAERGREAERKRAARHGRTLRG